MADYPISPVPFTRVRTTPGFWGTRQAANRDVTLAAAIAQCERSGRLENFAHAAEVMRRRRAGETAFQIDPPTVYPFDDTDAYKVIEGASYLLAARPDSALARKLDDWIQRIGAAQEPDGYLFTFRTMHPDSPGHEWVGQERWEKDPELSHELYNSGHLFEAGVAHFEATGRRELLDICLKHAELLWREFADGKLRIAPGHAIVEMGLAKLYRATGDARWLELARIFLDARGPDGPAYFQRHAPVVAQTEAVGHAVRANYLYAGMADVAALAGARDYFAATERLWNDVVAKKMELTGGVGAVEEGEQYGEDYALAQGGYNETCAAIALMLWAHRMFLMTGEGRYMDVFERAAYNGFLSGVSLTGDHFFYTNPVAYDGVRKSNHGHAGRAPWFGCACCPPNVLRTLAAFTSYLYATREDVLYVNLFVASEGTAHVAGTDVRLVQHTDYPWSGSVRLELSPEKPSQFSVRLRIPGWARGEAVPSDLYRYEAPSRQDVSVRVNGEPVQGSLDAGYVTLKREWRAGDTLELELAMPIRRVQAHPRVEAALGRVALERGPLVYCVERLDSAAPVETLSLPADSRISVVARPDFLGGLTTLHVEPPGAKAFDAIPYFAWNNRGLSAMAVWLSAPASVPHAITHEGTVPAQHGVGPAAAGGNRGRR